MSAPRYVIALDQGTTSSRSIVFDQNQQVVGVAQRELTQFFPEEGWVEHDPREIWASQIGTMNEAVAASGIDPSCIAAVGITNQRETTVIWDRATGEPIYDAIVWQCRRTAGIVDELVRQPGMKEHIRATTGLLPDAYFSATKIRWILDHVPSAQARAERGELAFGTIDSWLVWKLTGGAAHITDVTNASRTMLYDIHCLDWDDAILRALDIPRALLPEVRSNSEIYGYTDFMGQRIPVAGMAGDQQAALFGQACFGAGDAKCTYGTGCFLLMNTGDKVVTSENGLLSTIACQIDGKTNYVLEGSVFVGGSLIQWLRDGLGIIHNSSDTGRRAANVPDTGGVYLVPAFTGLGAPWWDMYARGTMVGITRGTTADHIIRAADEAIAYQVADLVCAMEADTGSPLTALRVDGGATRDAFLMQFQSDILGKQVLRPRILETTALGAACLAGLATGVWDGLDDIKQRWSLGHSFDPAMDTARAQQLVDGWHRAVDRSRGWIQPA
ncbi:glycerol kinase GlpK [Atopobium sp. oral taxon 810]|uniref:glycerol kinase GlpK n=1 Tax=Atopobium sp. oral taxon 810 TaxID=712158 RepID=UPI000396F143|nr:glycerol kinase GlpK [Atopobium sp. oral taxon 810]ERI04818.1 glycerol kinase [Atopobium sp. oral taxon 810 str. F0209]